jgi:hypothetical protein
MKILFTLLLSVTLVCSEAQISVTTNDMPSSNLSFLYETTTDLSGEDFTLTGSGYAWDFSFASANQNDTVFFDAVTSTPFAYQFFFNNQFQYPAHKANYASPGSDVNPPGGQVTIENRYNFFKNNSSSLEVVGFGAEINSIPASVKYDTIDQKYPLPMTMGTTDSTRAYYLTSVPSLGTYGQWIQRRVTVDGFGSLQTPIGTYADVIRVKTLLYQTDTIYVDQFMFGTTFVRPVETIYEWWDLNENTHLMKVNITGGNVTSAHYLLAAGVSVNELEQSQIKLIPQLNNNEFIIDNQSNTAISNVFATDLSGRRLDASITDNKLQVKSQSSQLVVITLELSNGKIWSQKVILK